MYLLSPISTLLLLGFSGATGSSLRRRLPMNVRDYGSISGTSMATNGDSKVEATVTSERGEESLFVQIEFVAIDEGDTSEDEGSDANAEKKRTKEPNIDILIDSDGS